MSEDDYMWWIEKGFPPRKKHKVSIPDKIWPLSE